MSTISVNFDSPSPSPINGYIVKYRKVGDANYSILTPNPVDSPAIINGVDLNFSYEGTIQCNCSNSVVSDKITFSTQACTGDNKKVINGQCTTGYRQDLTSISDGSGGYICTYRYAFLDGSFSNNFTEPTTTPCITA